MTEQMEMEAPVKTQEVRVVLQLEEPLDGRDAQQIAVALIESLKDQPFGLVHITVEEESAIYNPTEDRETQRFSKEVD